MVKSKPPDSDRPVSFAARIVRESKSWCRWLRRRLRDFLARRNEADKRFALMASLWILGGYLLATVPPTFIDPRLTSHVRWRVQDYAGAWLLWPIAVVVGVATFVSILKANTTGRRVFGTIVPQAGGYLVTLPIFLPRMPHVNVLFVGALWVAVSAAWTWVRYAIRDEMHGSISDVDKGARIEYLKQQVSFCEKILLGLAVAYLGLLVSALTTLRDAIRLEVPCSRQALLVDVNSNVIMVCLSLFLLFGLVPELARRRQEFCRRLLDIRADEARPQK